MQIAGGEGMQGVWPQATRRWWLGVFIAGALIAVLTQLKAQPAPGENDIVLAADNSLATALRNGDKSVARKLLSLEFTFTDEDGAIHERKTYLADLKSVAAESESDTKVKIYGLVAMVTGHHQTARGAETFFIDIWVKQKRAWRALTIQDVVLGAAAAPPMTTAALGAEAKPYECKNPCQTIPYRVRSPAEQDVVNAYQAIEKATVARDAAEWQKHVADEFEFYGSGRAPVTKTDRVATIERLKKDDTAVTVGEVQTMRLVVYGEGAAMSSSNVMPDNSRPPYRVTRVWVKRNGQWQVAISVRTDIKNP
jgi:hypothetical protein